MKNDPMPRRSPSPQKRVVPPRSWCDPATHPLVALDSPWYQLLVEVQHEIFEATAQFWAERGVKSSLLPITTGSISSPMGIGSDSLPVKVTLEGTETYLADSMQFMLEYACRLLPEGSWYVMPSFRGEAADATHLCQFFHSEAEIPGDLDILIGTVEDYLGALARRLVETSADGVRAAAGSVDHVEALANGSQVFTRLTFDEAADLVAGDADAVRVLPVGARTLTRYGERLLMERLGRFVWITHWDHLSVPFYQAFDGDRTGVARNADLLFGPGEIVGAGERHVHPQDLDRALTMHGVDGPEYAWYRALKERQPMLTSGFGMGIERFLMWLLAHDDIRDCQLLPRFNGEPAMP
jgi:asparaginyl-tRNA synthetase